MEGSLTLPPFSMLLFLGMSKLRFYIEAKMLLRFERTSPLDLSLDYLLGSTTEAYFFILGGKGTRFTHLCSDSGMTIVSIRGSRGRKDYSVYNFRFFRQVSLILSAVILRLG
jgi:hypothetical protein